MSHDRQRVQEDLRGVVSGEVACSDLMAELYATDAGPFHVKPLGVVRPRTTDDVVQVVQYAAENQISLHPRGAGTSAGGQTLGPGIILDFSRFMRRVFHQDDQTVTLEPGALVGQLNQRLAKSSRALGFDPFSSSVATVGGMIAQNYAGRYAHLVGSPADYLLKCEVVLANGTVMELGTHRLEPDLKGSTPPQLQRFIRKVAGLLSASNPPTSSVPSSTNGIVGGYPPGSVLGAESVHLAKLLAGSEGTLGVITRATLQVRPIPKHICVLPVFFDRIQRAAEAALLVRQYEPSACDLLDRRHLTMIREADPRYELAIPSWVEAMLIVEKCTDDLDSAYQQMREAGHRIQHELEATAAGDVATDAADVEFYRFLAQEAPQRLHRIAGRRRPVALADDLIVPPAHLGQLIQAIQGEVQRFGLTASLYAHTLSGRLSLRPFFDLNSADDRARIVPFSERIAEIVWELGGALGGDAACALLCGSRSGQRGAHLHDVLRGIKAEFDQQGILNPGKVVPTVPYRLGDLLHPLPQWSPELPGGPAASPDPSAATSHTEAGGSAATPGSPGNRSDLVPLTGLTPEYGWSGWEITSAAAKCSGCGVCRAEQDVRMCPINHIGPREEASPRAKANIIRALVTDAPNGKQTDIGEVKSLADLCVHCHMCRLECPADVDIPRLMVEAKAQYVRMNGLRFSDWIMAHVDGVAGFARRVRHLSNWILGSRTARWVLEKATGIARNRRLPMIERRSFLDEARRRRLTVPATGHHKVAYFVDTFVNYFDVELGLALAAVLEHNNIMVWVPPAQKHSAMPMIARGAVDAASEVARHNVGVLAEAVRQGHTIVATEPSAVLALTREYLALMPDDQDALNVAQNTVEACHFLWQLHLQQKLKLTFKRLDATIGYHVPCHLLALRIGTPAEYLLRLIPGLTVQRLEHGCSGMAGTYGLQQHNYRNSLRAGLELMTALRKTPLTAGTTECSTCRIQMQHGTHRPTIHPIKLLALSYGLMPELKRHLFSAGKELTLQS